MKKQVSFVILLLLGLLNLSVSAYELRVESFPEGSGSVSGGGTYEEGSQIWVDAYPNTGFRFLGWYDGTDMVSQNRDFYYNMPSRDVTLTARYEFRPDNPADPAMPDTTARYSFKAMVTPEGAGTVNVSTGRYAHGSQISLSAYVNSGFVFTGWYEGEELLSAARSHAFTMPSRDVELTAKYEFSPDNPGDPEAVAAQYPLTILREPECGGSVSPTSGTRYAEGTKVNLSASLNSGYVFDGWIDSFGSVISTSRSHTLTMPAAPTTVTARFRFSPANPDDPQSSTPTRSIIYGSREVGYPGGVSVFTVNLENSDAMNGIEVDLMLPSGIVFDMEGAMPADRAGMHTLTVEPLGAEGAWHLSLKGDESFLGGNGALVRIPVSIPADSEPGMVYAINLLNASVFTADGSKEQVGVRDGQVKVTRQPETLPDSPDFRVMSVSAETADVMPGDAVTVKWTVANEGNLDAAGGWSESLYLADSTGKRVMLGTVYYDGSGLAVGETVSRSATLTVPRLPGLSGKLNPVVTLMPYLASDELIQIQANNTATGESFPITLGQRLILTVPEIITEGKDVSVRGQLARSGRWDDSETFSLTAVDADSRLTLPESVIILPGQSAAWFKMDVVDNGVADPAAQVGLKASGEGYESVETRFTLRDSRLPAITLSADADEMKEGEGAVLKVSIPYALGEDLSVSLVASPAHRLDIPASLIIPAGKLEESVSIMAVDNDVVDGHNDVAIAASAQGYENGTEYLLVIDDEMPELQMTLSPAEVNENAGVMAVRGEISRTSNLDKRVTLMLTADIDGQVFFPIDRIVLEKGIANAEFTVGVLDNDKVEGDRDVEITASVFVSSCNCASVGGHAGSVSGILRILDNDRPSLELISSKSVVAEGDSNGVEVTLSRNAELDKTLTVTLSCDTPGALDMPQSVVIKKGYDKVSFKVTAPINETADDDRTVVVSAQAEGYASSNLWMMVTDRTLPDARISGISVSEKEVVAGGEVDVKLTLASTGVTPLPAQTCVAIYADGELIGRVWLQEPLAPGVSKEMVRKVTLPSRAGVCEIHAVANPDKAFKEINSSDNHSASVRITLTSPFKAGVEVSHDRISKGETVTVKGHLDSRNPEGQEVEVYMVNDGLRVAEKTIASADGTFEVSFTPYMAQGGHFSVGACCPGEDLTDEMASFEIIDLKRTDNEYVTCEGITGTASDLSIGIRNPCGLTLTALKAMPLNVPDGIKLDIKVPESLSPGENGLVKLEVTGTRSSEGRDWERFSLEVTSEEGAVLVVPIYWYCRNAEGMLSSELTFIEVDLPEDKTMEYPVTVCNNGVGATGVIDVVLPSWMRCAGPTRLPSLASGEETTFTLLLKPTSEMPLNHTVTGQLAVNCENGVGLVIGYRVMPVSDQPAVLAVDACDEYTYNTSEAPKVAGAKVSVVIPGNGFTVVEGVTDETGRFVAQLPAGYYRVYVSADRHDSWSGTVFLNPGKTKTVTANISFNPITISYTVVRTEVEDEYIIDTDVRYEMNVPAPVVRVIAPKRIDGDSMEVGDAIIINVQIVNEGLITASNTTLLLEKDNPEWLFEQLDYVEPFDLAAHQTVNIPVRITRIADTAAHSPRLGMKRSVAEDIINQYNSCMTNLAARYELLCGEPLSKNTPAENMAMKFCAASATLSAIMSAVEKLLGVPSGGGHGGGGGGSSSTGCPPIVSGEALSICDPCDAEKFDNSLDILLTTLNAPIGILWHSVKIAVDSYRNEGKDVKVVVKDAQGKVIHNALEYVKSNAGSLWDLAVMIYKMSRPCSESDSETGGVIFADVNPSFSHSWQETFYDESKMFCEGWKSVVDFFETILGDPAWIFDPTEDKLEYMCYVDSLEDGTVLSDEEVALRKPESVTFTQAREYVDRVKGVIDVATEYEETLLESIDTFAKVEDAAVEACFESGADRFFKAYEAYEAEFERLKDGSVCASVALRFSQTMTMTREAFRGTLEVFNGHDDTPMRDVKLNLTVTDPYGMVATSREFQINTETLTGFKGNLDLMSGWELNAGDRGVAEIIFIPTRNAAPEGPTVWDFGGSLTYVDPFTGLEVTRKLQPVSLTVNPTPEFDLTYFLQRDVYSDDPLTLDVVEQSEEAEFALVIRNSGVGDARNVRLVTQQPQIVDNEKGILLETAFTSSQLNGEERHMALGGSMASDFGDIPAGSSAYAQWWFESSLAGHFIDYDVNATHVSSYGNPDLSLLGEVEIHELIRGITDPAPSGEGIRRLFLANDIVDADDLPDMVYYSDASPETTLGRAIVSSEMIDRYTYRLNVQPLAPGWVYGSLVDPTDGRMRLVGITRMSDGMEIPVDNIWQTAMTMRDGSKPVHEARMHVAVNTEQAESYRLVFEARPSGVLEVSEVSGVPLDDNGPVEPVKNVKVSFTKEVDQDSFTSDALRLTRAGERVDLSDVKIDPVSSAEYSLELGNTTVYEGYYVLTVDASRLLDAEGYAGRNAKSVAWLQKGESPDGVTAIDGDPKEFMITPIPVRGDMTLSGNFSRIARLDVYDTAGTLLGRWHDLHPDSGADGRGAVHVDAGHIPSGVMVVTAVTDRGVIYSRRVLFITD